MATAVTSAAPTSPSRRRPRPQSPSPTFPVGSSPSRVSPRDWRGTHGPAPSPSPSATRGRSCSSTPPPVPSGSESPWGAPPATSNWLAPGGPVLVPSENDDRLYRVTLPDGDRVRRHPRRPPAPRRRPVGRRTGLRRRRVGRHRPPSWKPTDRAGSWPLPPSPAGWHRPSTARWRWSWACGAGGSPPTPLTAGAWARPTAAWGRPMSGPGPPAAASSTWPTPRATPSLCSGPAPTASAR